jgi:aminoglycoside phosphotransferase (APT) family kinase protein
VKTCDRRYESLVVDVVRGEIGPDATLEPVPTYPDTIVYEIVAPSIRAIFKAIDPAGRDPDGIALEAWACEAARDVGVPAPRVLVVDTTRARLPASFFIMEKAAGAPLERLSLPEDRLDALLTTFGSHLRALHEIRIPGFGWLDEDAFRTTGQVRGRAETWSAALIDEVEGSLRYLSGAGLAPGEIDEIRSTIEARGGRLRGFTDGRLLHGDIGLLHVWADPDVLQITGVVDFGERSSGDPASDFGDIEGQHLGSVLAGYGPEDPSGTIDAIRFYALVRAIPWAEKWHARGETQVLDWVRHVLREAR